MIRKPTSLSGIGFIQVFLAATFVLWLLFFPDTGASFAWPVIPRFSAMFIGASFVVRLYIGLFLWRSKYWHELRWQSLGNLAFLGVVFLATYWHIDEMNWKQNIGVAHVWVIAYTAEPVLLILLGRREHGEDTALPSGNERGPILEELRWLGLLASIASVTIGGLLFINPQFMDTRWPWPLDPFDARIMAAFMALVAVWSAQLYLSTEWSQVRWTVLGLALFATTHTLVWLAMFPQLDPARKNIWTYGIAFGLAAILLIIGYVRQELLYASTKRAMVSFK